MERSGISNYFASLEDDNIDRVMADRGSWRGGGGRERDSIYQGLEAIG